MTKKRIGENGCNSSLGRVEGRSWERISEKKEESSKKNESRPDLKKKTKSEKKKGGEKEIYGKQKTGGIYHSKNKKTGKTED